MCPLEVAVQILIAVRPCKGHDLGTRFECGRVGFLAGPEEQVVDAKGLVRCLAYRFCVCDDLRGSPAGCPQRAQATCVRDGGNKLRRRCGTHAPKDDWMRDVEKLANARVDHKVPTALRRRRQPTASVTGLPTRLNISTSVSIVNLAVFLFTTSDTRGRDTMSISAASACFR